MDDRSLHHGDGNTGRTSSVVGGLPTESRLSAWSASERAILGAKSFEIVVKGRLSPTLRAAIDGFEVSYCDRGLTHLVGWVPDQSRLFSTLELLRDLNIELISVNPEPAQQPDGIHSHE